MKLKGSIALVTGANRGLGRALVEALQAAGCAKIYAAARSTAGTGDDGVTVPVRLDITKTDEVAAAARACADVTLLINNAGVARFRRALAAPTMDDAASRWKPIISARSPCAAPSRRC